jgi:ABC-2 type transport system ATP-binding protein
VLASGSVAELTSSAGTETVLTVNYDGPAAGIRGVSSRPGVSKVEISGTELRVYACDADGLLGDLVAAGVAAGRRLRDASVLRPSLERAFLTLTGREYRE